MQRDAFLLTPDPTATSELNRLTSMHGEWRCWFSREGSWCLLQREQWFSVLGGTPGFMETYLGQAGGMDAVRKRFEDFDISQAWEPNSDRSWADWRERTYAGFGWVPFAYPNQGEFFERLPSRDEIDATWAPRVRCLLRLPLPAQVRDALPNAECTDVKALLAVLAEREDWEIGLYSPNRDRWSVVVADDISLGTAAEVAGDLLIACGGKNDWALISLPEGVSVLAGEDRVIDRLQDRAERLKTVVTNQRVGAPSSEYPGR